MITLADNPRDIAYSKNLRKYCRQVEVFYLNTIQAKIKGMQSLLSGQSISQGYFFKKQFLETLERWVESETYDILFCFSSSMAEYVFKSKKTTSRIAKKLVMDFCDLDSDKWRQYAGNSSFPLNILYKAEASRLLNFEKKINKTFHRSIFVSPKEAELFRTCHPEARHVEIVSNGVDHGFFDADKVKLSDSYPSDMIVFSGAMDYYANIDGVIWFSEKILPEIKKNIPGVRFFIVGSNPDTRVKMLETDPGITVTGFVEDIREYYKAADICVTPLRIARGVQNKVLEAMAMKKAIVTTSNAVQGISLHGQGELPLVIENDAGEFARQVVILLKDKARCHSLGGSARSFILDHYQWDKTMQVFKNI